MSNNWLIAAAVLGGLYLISKNQANTTTQTPFSSYSEAVQAAAVDQLSAQADQATPTVSLKQSDESIMIGTKDGKPIYYTPATAQSRQPTSIKKTKNSVITKGVTLASGAKANITVKKPKMTYEQKLAAVRSGKKVKW